MSSFNKIIVLNLLLLPLVLLVNCSNQENKEFVNVDFSKKETAVDQNLEVPTFALNMAVSAMISPKDTYIYFQQLLDYISKKIDIPVTLKQRKTYQEVNDLLETGASNFAFICSGAYIRKKKNSNIELLVVPLVNGEPHYYSYIIVHKDSSIKKFEDLYGHTFAFTDPMSNTGRLYPVHLLSKLKKMPKDFFSKIIYTHAHDYSIHATARKIVDGASVDSLVYEFIRKSVPAEIVDIRIIKKSPPFGIPPFVVNKNINSRMKNKLRKTLLSMHKDIKGREILKHLMLEKFIVAQDNLYDSVRDMYHSVNRIGLKQSQQ